VAVTTDMILRDYQTDAVNSIVAALSLNINPLLVAPTGSGKTVMASAVAKQTNLRTLFLAHRRELIKQAEETFSRYNIDADFDTVQSEPYEHDGLIIFDEAHHAVAATWDKWKQMNPESQMLAITATPDRLDRRRLEDSGFVTVNEIHIADLIKRGHLSGIRNITLNLELNPGDEDMTDEVLSELADKIAEAIRSHSRRATIAFLPLIKTSQRFAQMMRQRGIRAGHADGTDTIDIERYKSGEIEMICNSSLLTEGFDAPKTDCVILLRPTESRALYSQMIGRGLRTCEGKDYCIAIDPLWQSNKHSLATPESIFGSDEQILAEARKDKKPGTLEDPTQKLAEAVARREADLARRIAEAELLRQEKQARIENRQEQIRQIERKKARKKLAGRNILSMVGLFHYPAPGRPSDKDCEMLDRLGFDSDECGGGNQATEIATDLLDRKANRLASLPQIRAMHRLRCNFTAHTTVAEASALLDSEIKRRQRFRYRR
jgi:superfamily II DNA or RNA helicase